MSAPNKRNVTAGPPRQRPGYPTLALPTQSAEDRHIVEVVQFRALDTLPPYGSAHPRSALHKLRKQEFVGADETFVFYQQTYMLEEGAKVSGSVVDGSTQGATGTSETQRVPAGTQADEGFGVVSSNVSGEDAQNSTKQTVRVAEFPALVSKRIDSQGWGATSTETRQTVPSDTEPGPGGLLVLESAVVARDKHHSEKAIRTIEGWPVLYGTHIDSNSGIEIEVVKRMVAAGTRGGVLGDVYTEVQAVDKFKSIAISSRVMEPLPPPEVIPLFADVSLPSELLEVKVVWDKQHSVGGSVSKKGAGASYKIRINGVIIPKTRDGFRGPVKGRLTRSYHKGLPDLSDIPNPLKIIPVSGMAYIMHKWSDQDNSINDNGASISVGAGVRTATVNIGHVLTNGVGLTGDAIYQDSDSTSSSSPGPPPYVANAAATAYGSAVLDLPVSEPASLGGQTIVKAVDISKWRLGVYVMEIVELDIPAYGPTP